MAGTPASINENLSVMMTNVSSCEVRDPHLELSKGILPAIFIESLGLSAWQYIVLFLAGLIVYDQGNHYCLSYDVWG